MPVFNYGLTLEEITDIERVQKSFLHIALGKEYPGYQNALQMCQMETLEERRIKLCKTFAIKADKARLTRYSDSPIPYLTKLLNS